MKKLYVIIALILLFAGGIIDHYLFIPKSSKIVIGKPTVSDTVHKPVLNQAVKDNDSEAYKRLALSALNIAGEIKGNNLEIDAWDEGKSVHATFPIECDPATYTWTYQVSYIAQYYDSKLHHSYGVMVFRHYGAFAFGAGPVLGDNIGVQVAAQYSH